MQTDNQVKPDAEPEAIAPVRVQRVVGHQEPATTNNEILEPEASIAREACAEGQPMPLNGADAATVADICEIIGEAHAAEWKWRECAMAHRMACWYYRKALND